MRKIVLVIFVSLIALMQKGRLTLYELAPLFLRERLSSERLSPAGLTYWRISARRNQRLMADT